MNIFFEKVRETTGQWYESNFTKHGVNTGADEAANFSAQTDGRPIKVGSSRKFF